jgi:hypothetical protein
MSPSRIQLAVLVVASASIASPSNAHFVLTAPAATNEQSDVGNPQMDAPCGDEGAVKTGALTPFTAGETIDVTIDEKIFHPGHYRVALAIESANELPQDPIVTLNASGNCGTALIQDPPVFPILADGVLAHTSEFAGPQTLQVTLPEDLVCERCTLQVIEFIGSHSLPCFHHHCAEIQVPEPGAIAAALAAVAALASSARSRATRR